MCNLTAEGQGNILVTSDFSKPEMSLDATSFRYEAMKTKRPSRAYTETKQHNLNVEKTPDAVRDEAIREREKWNERLDELWWRKRVYRENQLKRQEITLANKELTLIRRAQMKELYNQEFKNIEKELNQSQKAFYKKRL